VFAGITRLNFSAALTEISMLATDPLSTPQTPDFAQSAETELWAGAESAVEKENAGTGIFCLFRRSSRRARRRKACYQPAPTPTSRATSKASIGVRLLKRLRCLGFHGDDRYQTGSTRLPRCGSPKRPQVTQRIQKSETAYPNRIDLNPNYTFDRFIKGPSNEHAYAAPLSGLRRSRMTITIPFISTAGWGSARRT
jgi:chromosomal replication initiation ATPase DnaA